MPLGSRRSLAQQFAQRGCDAEGDFGHPGIVERVWCVGGLVVIWIAQEAGVGEHQGGIALVPERAVVAETDLVDLLG